MNKPQIAKVEGACGSAKIPWDFLASAQTRFEEVAPGRTHHWYVEPNSKQSDSLVLVRAEIAPGAAHAFHTHPEMDEIIYILSGEAEQWCGTRMQIIGAGDVVYVPRGVVHGTYNISNAAVIFLAILSPAKVSGPVAVDVAEEEPWRSMRSGG